VAPAGLRINWLREAEAVDTQIEIFSWAKVPEAPDCAFSLIADEAHYAQNLKASRTKRFLALAKAAKAVYALTGTPIKNGRPTNLFPLLLATGHELSQDKKAYEMRYCAAHATRWTQWDVTGAAHLDELHRKISDGVLRRMKSECLDLPEKVRVLKKAELSEEASRLYSTTLAEMQAEYRKRRDAGEIGEADTLVLMNHLRHAGSLAKVESAVDMAEEVIEQGGQVVLFTAFTDSAAQIADALNAGRITGAEDAEKRQAAIDKFQAGESKAIVCTLGAGNVGITLTAAQTVILVDRPWTPGDAVQAEDRLHRIGQKGSVLAVWLQANGADEAIDALLEQKHERIELVLAGKRKSLRGIGSIGDVAEAVLG
jgi:SNF2 family DNA or RNA helicase